LRTYAAFVVWARCAFDEVALALPNGERRLEKWKLLESLDVPQARGGFPAWPRLPNAEQGQIYSSLSTIALRITGTTWSGRRFFSLRPWMMPPTVTE
jgi:Protein of unknown function (DUF2924)